VRHQKSLTLLVTLALATALLPAAALAQGDPNVICGTINRTLVQSMDGSTFDFVTGQFGTYDPDRVDDINLYDVGYGMYTYWYGDVSALDVGGVIDGGGEFAVLQEGDVVGPASAISAASKAMTNWLGGASGYIGIAFENEDTGLLNYGWIQMTTSGPDGYPATWGDYCYNNAGEAITIGGSAEQPNIDVDPLALASTQGANTTTTQMLTIANTGEADLEWEIEEEPALVRPIAPSRVGRDAGDARRVTIVPRRVTIGDAILSRSGLAAGQVVTPERAATPDALETITHSASQTIEAGNSVHCGDQNTGYHTDNSYLREFDLNAFGITADFDVTEVEFGIEEAEGAGGSQPVTVRLFTKNNPAGALTWANLTEIGSASATVPDQNLTRFTVPVTGSAPAGSVLVVEVFTPNGQTAGHTFFIGSNSLGQTAPSYLAAEDCGIAEPTSTAAIGFPNMHIVMNVTGDTEFEPQPCDDPADVAWLSVSPDNGTTAPGASTPVAVTFDSTGLAAGTYNANLCVTSNDPDPGPGNGTNLVVVPVELTVEDIGPGPSVLEIPTLAPIGGALLGLALAGLGLGVIRRRRA